MNSDRDEFDKYVFIENVLVDRILQMSSVDTTKTLCLERIYRKKMVKTNNKIKNPLQEAMQIFEKTTKSPIDYLKCVNILFCCNTIYLLLTIQNRFS